VLGIPGRETAEIGRGHDFVEAETVAGRVLVFLVLCSLIKSPLDGLRESSGRGWHRHAPSRRTAAIELRHQMPGEIRGIVSGADNLLGFPAAQEW
jgi:hypothetical protein